VGRRDLIDLVDRPYDVGHINIVYEAAYPKVQHRLVQVGERALQPFIERVSRRLHHDGDPQDLQMLSKHHAIDIQAARPPKHLFLGGGRYAASPVQNAIDRAQADARRFRDLRQGRLSRHDASAFPV